MRSHGTINSERATSRNMQPCVSKPDHLVLQTMIAGWTKCSGVRTLIPPSPARPGQKEDKRRQDGAMQKLWGVRSAPCWEAKEEAVCVGQFMHVQNRHIRLWRCMHLPQHLLRQDLRDLFQPSHQVSGCGALFLPLLTARRASAALTPGRHTRRVVVASPGTECLPRPPQSLRPSSAAGQACRHGRT